MDVATQRALLTEADLTFNRAVEIATAREAAAKDVRVMGGHAENVMSVTSSRKNINPNKALSNSDKSSFSGMSNSKPSKACTGCGALHWR